MFYNKLVVFKASGKDDREYLKTKLETLQIKLYIHLIIHNLSLPKDIK